MVSSVNIAHTLERAGIWTAVRLFIEHHQWLVPLILAWAICAMVTLWILRSATGNPHRPRRRLRWAISHLFGPHARARVSRDGRRISVRYPPHVKYASERIRGRTDDQLRELTGVYWHSSWYPAQDLVTYVAGEAPREQGRGYFAGSGAPFGAPDQTVQLEDDADVIDVATRRKR